MKKESLATFFARWNATELPEWRRRRAAERERQWAEAAARWRAKAQARAQQRNGAVVAEPEVRTEPVAIPAKAVRRESADERLKREMYAWADRVAEEDRQEKERSRQEIASFMARDHSITVSSEHSRREVMVSFECIRTEEGLLRRRLPDGRWEVAMTPAQIREWERDSALSEARRKENGR